MLITKIIETTVDLLNPADIYNADIDAVIKRALETRYVGRCFKAMLITAVNRILKRSDITMVTNRLDGGAQVDVQIELEGHILFTGEVLHGCRVIEMRPGMIVAEHDIAKIHVRPGEATLDAVIKVGAILPINVQEARYMVNTRAITVIGNLFKYTPPNSMLEAAGQPLQKNMPEFFKITGDLADFDERARVERQIAQITALLDKREADIEKGMSLLSCATKPPDFEHAVASITEIESLDELTGKRVFTNAELNGHVFLADKIATNKSADFYECSLYMFSMAMANRYLARLTAAIGFTEHAEKYPKTYMSVLRGLKLDV